MKTKTNFKHWIKKIFLLGQKDFYASFTKIYLFIFTHFSILCILHISIQIMANLQEGKISSKYFKVGIPTALSYWLFFRVGSDLTERTLSIMALFYSYISLFILCIFNFKSIVKFYFGKNVYKN